MRKFLLLVALLFPLSACGDDPTDPTQAVVGTYTLVQVNGANLPALVLQNATGRYELLSGTLTLRSDQSFSQILTVRLTPPGSSFPLSEIGTFSVSGNTVNFQTSAGATYSGTLSGNMLTVNAIIVGQGFIGVYQKQ